MPRSPVIGDDEFVARFKAWAARANREVPRRERELERRSLDALFAGAVTREARNACMAGAYRQGYPMAQIARYLGVHYSTVSKAIAGARP
jgi:DNA-directed RNA polymerase specialized sigma24 family protein